MEWAILLELIRPFLQDLEQGRRRTPPQNCAVVLINDMKLTAIQFSEAEPSEDRFTPAVPVSFWPAFRLGQYENSPEMVEHINRELAALSCEARVSEAHPIWYAGALVHSARANWLKKELNATKKQLARSAKIQTLTVSWSLALTGVVVAFAVMVLLLHRKLKALESGGVGCRTSSA